MKNKGENMSIKECSILVGIDWADKKHVYAVKKPGEEKARIGSFLQKADSIHEWMMSLKKKAGDGKVAIALEQSKGALLFALLKYDFAVIYPIPPATVAKYRETWKTSGAKDDPSDAVLILELLEEQNKRLKPLTPEPKEICLLQHLTEHRQKLMHDLKRIGNRVTSAVKEYYPVILELFPRIYKNITAEFLLAFPTLSAAQAASDKELVSFFRTHSAGGQKRMEKRITLIRQALALTEDEAVIESRALLIQALALQLKAINQGIKAHDEQIERIYQTLPDKKLFDSLPSTGEVTAPRLLAALGTNRKKFDSSNELSCFSGIAPVVARSGNQSWIHWRYRCNKVVRQAFIDWANLSIRTSFWAKAFYASQRSKGKTHSVAIRALAFKWTRIIFKMWKDRTPYSESKYLEALRKSGSPLLKNISCG